MVTTPTNQSTTLTIPPKTWHPATWELFVRYCEESTFDEVRAFYNAGLIWVDMGNEGINHSNFCQLISMIFLAWFAKQGQSEFSNLGGCVLEKPTQRGAAPDIVLYVGADFPQWQPGERRRINLDQWRVPNLVGEVADTTLPTDLDEKKHLYAALEIPEYWVIDVTGCRVFAFRLNEQGAYDTCDLSGALKGLPIVLLNQTVARLKTESNGGAALWFGRQLEKSNDMV